MPPNGVSAKVPSPYYYGSAVDQADKCATAAGIKWAVDDKVLAIWPKTGARGGAVPAGSRCGGRGGQHQPSRRNA